MIYDCFLYNGEADILELRLHELADVVDRFIIVESCETFTGLEQPLDTSVAMAGPWLDDFPRYVQVAGRCPRHFNAWQREAHQRNAIGDALRALNAQPDDLILVSDVDEIPRAECVAATPQNLELLIANGGGPTFAFRQETYFYHPQCLNLITWYGTRAVFYRDLTTPQALRATEYLRPREASYDRGGWHFSYFMDTAAIQRKLAAYSHTEVNQPPYNTAENIEAAMRECRSLVPTDGQRFRRVNHSGENAPDLPAYMLAHPERYGLEVAACVS